MKIESKKGWDIIVMKIGVCFSIVLTLIVVVTLTQSAVAGTDRGGVPNLWWFTYPDIPAGSWVNKIINPASGLNTTQKDAPPPVTTSSGVLNKDAPPSVSISSEDEVKNTAAVEAFYGLLNSHDDVALAGRVASVVDVNWVDMPVSQGLEGFVKAITAYHQNVPDIQWTTQQIIREGDTYVVRGILSGTPVCDFLGLGNLWITGNRFEITGIHIHTLQYGKIVKSYRVEDWREAMRQLSLPEAVSEEEPEAVSEEE